MNLSSLIDADVTVEEPDSHKVFFLPVGLTAVQRRLVDVLITAHRPSLTAQLRGEDSLTKSESQDNNGVAAYLTEEQMGTLLSTSLFAISNHPYLLVEHFMPKRLLLMESHERLMAASDKFAKFDRLIGAIGDLAVDVIVVGHNIKELDLIEAFVLGRKLAYKRYSGTSLHDSKRSSSNGEKKLAVKDDDYAPKIRPKPVDSQVRLHLTTSQQLSASPFTGVKPQFIVSFDAMLDENNPNVQYLRLAHTEGVPVPLIKLLVLQSHLHGIIANPDWTLPEADVKKRSLFSSLVSRNLDLTQEFQSECGILFENVRAFFQAPLTATWPIDTLPEFKSYTDEEVLKSVSVDYSLIEKKDESHHRHTGKKLKLDSIVVPELITSFEYKSILAKLTIEKINLLHDTIEDNKKDLMSLRIASTLLHSADDTMKLSVGSVFKDSLTLKEQATSAEKRLERLELEYEKFHDKEEELEKEVEVLKLINSGSKLLDDAELDKELEELQETLSNLQDETKNLGDKTDNLRQQYQSTTSTAAEKATKLKASTDLNKSLTSQLEGPGMKLRQLSYEERKLSMKDQITKMSNELKFLEFYHEKLSQTVKEWGATLNVGRNGRIHRSTTPYI